MAICRPRRGAEHAAPPACSHPLPVSMPPLPLTPRLMMHEAWMSIRKGDQNGMIALIVYVFMSIYVVSCSACKVGTHVSYAPRGLIEYWYIHRQAYHSSTSFESGTSSSENCAAISSSNSSLSSSS
jgi:hypothetical protein